MNNIIDFKPKHVDDYEFEEPVKGDGYLELTGINLIEIASKKYNVSSIKEIQQHLGLEETGKFGLAELASLLPLLNPDDIQPVLNYISRVYTPSNTNINNTEEKPKKEKKNSKSESIKMTITLVVLFTIFLYGLVEVWIKIYDFLYNTIFWRF